MENTSSNARNSYTQSKPQYVQAHIINDYGTHTSASNWSTQTSYKNKGASLAGGAVKIAGGLTLAAIGVPMLILPGPGLLGIAGGLALAASGTKQVVSALKQKQQTRI